MKYSVHDIKKHFEERGYQVTIRKINTRHLIEFLEGFSPERLYNLIYFYFGEDPKIYGYGMYGVLLQDFDPKGYSIGGICKKCGCTQNDACADPDTGTCFWLSEELCSACGTPEERTIALTQIKASWKLQ